ncbi:TlpA family protein disulfide reductase [Labilibacter sediminis]|nr:TlpA family protein disulfide reductase [Labilibacter sediminis]
MFRLFFVAILLSFFVIEAKAQTVRNFSANTVSNDKVTFSGLKGHNLTIIDFWASWCKPCIKSMPLIEKIYNEFKTDGVNVIGFNVDGPRSVSKVKPIISSLNISYPIILDTESKIMRDLNIEVLPSLLIVDTKGKVLYRHEGYVKGDEIEWRDVIVGLLSK